MTQNTHLPEILAPAGDMPAALAAFAAGADAVYLGLKNFSARMQAENFSLTDLSQLTGLARAEKRRVYVALNSILKPGDLDAAGRLIARLERGPKPDALIVQDLGCVELARQVGFSGEIHLSTLANITHPAGLAAARALGAARAIAPREASIDELRTLADACPDGFGLETFIHGALCYCVSGRCYWSSYMGGKSGLRGRCVQPCRRVYKLRQHEGRFFSCTDLSLDVLVKTLMTIPKILSWKIEGRKKGPYYVFNTVTAYRMLRDHGDDPQARKDACSLLGMALGRPASHARFLPQRGEDPVAPHDQTSSGLLAGKISFDKVGNPVLKPRFELLPKDFLRIGIEDEAWHSTLPVTRRTPKGGTLTLRVARHKIPKSGTSVFLIDRRDPDLTRLLGDWAERLGRAKAVPEQAIEFTAALPKPVNVRAEKRLEIILSASLPQGRESKEFIKPGTVLGLWLSPKTSRECSRTLHNRISWWLPPVIWPDEEALWQKLVREVSRNGGRHFVLNAPWQISLFENGRGNMNFTAGPFCNVSNPAAVAVLAGMGFTAAMVSPELAAEDILALPKQSCLPLGILLDGFWPVGVSRYGGGGMIKADAVLASPKGETFWTRRYGGNTWIYPGWPLELTAKRPELEQAGYSTFVHMREHPPEDLQIRRSSQFNWDVGLL